MNNEDKLRIRNSWILAIMKVKGWSYAKAAHQYMILNMMCNEVPGPVE